MNLCIANARRLPLPDSSVDMIFTDPPYLGDQIDTYDFLADEAARVLKPFGFVLAMCGGNMLNRIFDYFSNAGLSYYWLYQLSMGGEKTGIVWKHHTGRRMPVAVRDKHVIAYSKGRSISRIATTSRFSSSGGDKRFHVWGQDVNSARYYIDAFSKVGDLVLDPFVGGGTTLAACRLLNRRGIGFDIDPSALHAAGLRFDGRDFLGMLFDHATDSRTTN